MCKVRDTVCLDNNLHILIVYIFGRHSHELHVPFDVRCPSTSSCPYCHVHYVMGVYVDDG